MALNAKLEPGEHPITEVHFLIGQNSPSLKILLTNKAIYLPYKKLIAVSDADYFKRILLSHVTEVRVKQVKPYSSWLIAAAMFLFGVLTLIGQIMQALDSTISNKTYSGWSVAFIVGGLILPFAGRRRLALEVFFVSGVFRWNAPLVFGEKKNQIQETLIDFLKACRNVGIDKVSGATN